MLKIIKQKESETLEFKSSLGEWKETIETISAFANSKGGRIVVGVSQSGKLLGLAIGKGTVECLTNQISQNTDPKIHPRITTEKIGDKSIVIIEVKESSDHLVLAFGRPFKKAGKSTVKMSKDEYERLILEKHKDKLQFDTQFCPRATIKNIDGGKLKWFLRKAKEERNYDVDPETPINEAIDRLGLIQAGKFTNTAILLFGRDPQRFFPQAKIRAGRFKGTNGLDFIDMKV